MARILIVDDDPAIRESIRAMLETDGHGVSEAANGVLVDAIVEAWAPDIIVLDILMPAKDGIETITSLRRAGHTVKIIAMSGPPSSPFMDFLRIARRLGAQATLKKPFNADTLRAMIDKVLKLP
jgi:two-component system, chemotaxis family, chemotaxis protein CheY